jgi:hypothetical protein
MAMKRRREKKRSENKIKNEMDTAKRWSLQESLSFTRYGLSSRGILSPFTLLSKWTPF